MAILHDSAAALEPSAAAQSSADSAAIDIAR